MARVRYWGKVAISGGAALTAFERRRSRLGLDFERARGFQCSHVHFEMAG